MTVTPKISGVRVCTSYHSRFPRQTRRLKRKTNARKCLQFVFERKSLYLSKFFFFGRGSHIMQGNSLLALAGLVSAVFNYLSLTVSNIQETQGTKNTSESHITMEEWIARITDTKLTILDGNLETFGAPMAWCQQVRCHIKY